jgi:hypothetical protein
MMQHELKHAVSDFGPILFFDVGFCYNVKCSVFFFMKLYGLLELGNTASIYWDKLKISYRT